jgi:hypothetical protein
MVGFRTLAALGGKSLDDLFHRKGASTEAIEVQSSMSSLEMIELSRRPSLFD